MQKSKNSWVSVSNESTRRLPKLPKRVLLVSGLLIGAACIWLNQEDVTPERIAVPLNLAVLEAQDASISKFFEMTPSHEFEVKSGDTLSGLFQQAGIDQQTMYRVLEADLNVLALDTLMPGNRVMFYLNDQGELTKLELYFNAARQVIFTRESDGSYQYKEAIHDGFWQSHNITGVISGSFYLSAKRMGLDPAHIQRIEELLKEKINFSRDFRPGDKFSVLVKSQYVDGDPTGNTEVTGISIEPHGKKVMAFQFNDGQFYDENGHSLVRAFQRLPLLHSYRISSRFNPHRLHPITGRIAPHNGTDFATPVGTKVIAPGDGVVSLVVNHRYAGKYIVIDHGPKYRTRYLHLSKAMVKKGQHVTRGQVIALTGNTGRTTGPHLHYEFIINGRPVNALKAKIPMAEGLNKRELKQFHAMVIKRKLQMGLV